MHKLEELENFIGMLRDYRLAIEFRNRNWVIGDQLRSTIDFFETAQSSVCERRCSECGTLHDHAVESE
jgi:hypothetical protein